MFEIKIVDKIKTHILFAITFLKKSNLYEINVEKFGRARQAAHDKVMLPIKISLACQTTKARLETHTNNI